MLSKKNRANTQEVEKIFKEGGSLSSSSLTFKYIKNKEKGIKISFIAPKSVAKLAVSRNLLRRHGYSALEKHIVELPFPIIGVFVFKKYQGDVLTLSNEIKIIFSKIH